MYDTSYTSIYKRNRDFTVFHLTQSNTTTQGPCSSWLHPKPTQLGTPLRPFHRVPAFYSKQYSRSSLTLLFGSTFRPGTLFAPYGTAAATVVGVGDVAMIPPWVLHPVLRPTGREPEEAPGGTGLNSWVSLV